MGKPQFTEELEHAFVRRAVNEGVSDLHMIERIMTSQVSKSVQQMFVENQDMHGRMRMLRSIAIGEPLETRLEVIEQSRYDEIWDDGEFLKTSHAPLAIGDVIETIAGDTTRRFILLGQPCDLALRGDGKRSAQIGQLVSFRKIANDHLKKSTVYAGRKINDLQIGKGGGYFRFDYRQASPAQLEVLDLATFNEDGVVAVQNDHDFNAALLPGQAKGLRTANKLLERIVNAQNNAQENPDELRKADARCKLTLSFDGHFKSVCTPTFSKNCEVAKLDWNLKRTKRLRSPYVDTLMDQQLAILNRRALELGYLDETETVTADCGTEHPSAVN